MSDVNNNKRPIFSAASVALIFILATALFWFFFFPAAVTITGEIFGIMIAGVVIFAIGVFLLFIFSGIAIFISVIPFFILTLIGIVLFPVLLPVFIPLFIIYLFIAFLRRKKNNNK